MSASPTTRIDPLDLPALPAAVAVGEEMRRRGLQAPPAIQALTDEFRRRGLVGQEPGSAEAFNLDPIQQQGRAYQRFQQIDAKYEPPSEDDRRNYVESRTQEWLLELEKAQLATASHEREFQDTFAGRRIYDDQLTYDQRQKLYGSISPKVWDGKRDQFAKEFDTAHTPMAEFVSQRDEAGQILAANYRQAYPEATDQDVFKYVHGELARQGFTPNTAGELPAVLDEASLDDWFKQMQARESPLVDKGVISRAGPLGIPVVGDAIAGAIRSIPNGVNGVINEFGLTLLGTELQKHFGTDLGIADVQANMREYYDGWVARGPLRASEKPGTVGAIKRFSGSLGQVAGDLAQMMVMARLGAGAGSAAGLTARGQQIVAELTAMGFMGAKEGGGAYGQIYTDLRNKGYDHQTANDRAALAGLSVGIVNAMLEKVPLDSFVFKNADDVGRFSAALRGLVAEGSTEAAQEVVNILGEFEAGASKGAIVSWDNVERIGTAALAGGIVGGVVGGVQGGKGTEADLRARVLQEIQQRKIAEFQDAVDNKRIEQSLRDQINGLAPISRPDQGPEAINTGTPQSEASRPDEFATSRKDPKVVPTARALGKWYSKTYNDPQGAILIEQLAGEVKERFVLTEVPLEFLSNLPQTPGDTDHNKISEIGKLSGQEIADLPPVIAIAGGNGELLLIDGHHRTNGLREGGKVATIRAYVPQTIAKQIGDGTYSPVIVDHGTEAVGVQTAEAEAGGGGQPVEADGGVEPTEAGGRAGQDVDRESLPLIDRAVIHPQTGEPTTVRMIYDQAVKAWQAAKGGGSAAMDAAMIAHTNLVRTLAEAGANMIEARDLIRQARAGVDADVEAAAEVTQAEPKGAEAETTEAVKPSEEAQAEPEVAQDGITPAEGETDQERIERAESGLEREYDLARTDALTDIPNLRKADEQLSDMFDLADEQGVKVAVGGIDLVLFKHINDVLGHGAGNQALQILAETLRDGIRSEGRDGGQADVQGVFARLGGDEFEFALWGVDAKQAETIGNRLARDFADRMEAAGLKLPAGLRAQLAFGLSVRDPGATKDIEPFRKAADRDLERRKGEFKRKSNFPTDRAAAADMISRFSQFSDETQRRIEASGRPINYRVFNLALALDKAGIEFGATGELEDAGAYIEIPGVRRAIAGVSLPDGWSIGANGIRLYNKGDAPISIQEATELANTIGEKMGKKLAVKAIEEAISPDDEKDTNVVQDQPEAEAESQEPAEIEAEAQDQAEESDTDEAALVHVKTSDQPDGNLWVVPDMPAAKRSDLIKKWEQAVRARKPTSKGPTKRSNKPSKPTRGSHASMVTRLAKVGRRAEGPGSGGVEFTATQAMVLDGSSAFRITETGKEKFWPKQFAGVNKYKPRSGETGKILDNLATAAGETPTVESLDVIETRRRVLLAKTMTSDEYSAMIVVVNPDGTLGFATGSPKEGTAEVNVQDGARQLKAAISPTRLLEALDLAYAAGNDTVTVYLDKYGESGVPALIVAENEDRLFEAFIAPMKFDTVSGLPSGVPLDTVAKVVGRTPPVRISVKEKQDAEVAERTKKAAEGLERKSNEDAQGIAAGKIKGKTFKHFTTAESANALRAGEPFDPTRNPVHAIMEGNSEQVAEGVKFAGKRLYLSLDDTRWGSVSNTDETVEAVEARKLGREPNDSDAIYYDYKTQKWMVRPNALSRTQLDSVGYRVKPNAKVVVIDSPVTLRMAMDVANVDNPLVPAFWDNLAKQGYEVVAITNIKQHGDRNTGSQWWRFFAQAGGDSLIVLYPPAVELAEDQGGGDVLAMPAGGKAATGKGKRPAKAKQPPTPMSAWTSDYNPLEGRPGAFRRSPVKDVPAAVKASIAKARARRDARTSSEADNIYAIVTDLARRFGLGPPGNARAKVLAKQAAGFYRPVSEAIRLRRGSYVVTFVHELGHHLHKVMFPRRQQRTTTKITKSALHAVDFPKHWRKELVAMGQALYGSQQPNGSYAMEGWAEAVRFLVTNPAHLKAAAPTVYTDVVRVLTTQHPEVWASLLDARVRLLNAVKLMINDPVDQYVAHEGPRTSFSFRNLYDDLRTRLFDRYQRLVTFVKDLELEHLPANLNPHTLALRANGHISGDIKLMMEFGTFNPADATKAPTGKSLIEILRPVSDGDNLRLWQNYMVAKRALEKRAQGFEVLPADFNLPPHTTRADLMDYIARVTKEHPEFVTVAEEFQTFNEWLVKDYAVYYGLLSQEQAKLIVDKNLEYITFRYMKTEDALQQRYGKSAASGFTGMGSGFRRFRNSKGEQIYPPLESFMGSLQGIVSRARLNQVARSVVSHFNRTESGVGRWMDKIDRPMKSLKVMPEEVQQLIRDNLGIYIGDDGQISLPPWLQGISDDDLGMLIQAWVGMQGMTLWRPDRRTDRENREVTVMQGGKPTFWEIKDARLYELLEGLNNPAGGNLLVKFLSIPGRILRAGATQLNPSFFIPNYFRDLVQAVAMTDSDMTKLGQQARRRIEGIREAFLGGDIYRMFLASGADLSGIFGEYHDPKTGKLDMQAMFGKPRLWGVVHGSNAKQMLKDFLLLGSIDRLNRAFELANRLGEFNVMYHKLRSEGKSEAVAVAEAGQAAADITLDFQRGGTWSKQANEVVVFFNAAMLGIDKLARHIQKNPARAAGRIFTYLIMPSLASLLANWDNEDYWAKPLGMRDRYWYFPTGTDDLGRQTYIKLPKPYGLGVFSIAFERTFARSFGIDPMTGKRGDMGAYRDIGHALLNEFRPTINFAGIQPLVEVMAGDRGYSFYRDAEIVSVGDQDLPLGEQGASRSSELARILGRWMDYPPAKIDYLIQGWGGGLAKDAVSTGIDPIIRQVDPDAAAGEPITFSDWLVVRRFMASNTRSGHEAVTRFFDVHDRLQRIHAGLKARENNAQDYDDYRELHQAELALWRPYSRAQRRMSDLFGKIRKTYATKQDRDPAEVDQDVTDLYRAITEIARNTEQLRREALQEPQQ